MGQNETSVIPAGEFQPSDDSPFARSQDFDLWKAIMREYAEEFLGLPEARFRQGAPLDYENSAPYSRLSAGRRAGSIRPYILSIAIDPLNWKVHIRAVCIFEGKEFDEIFAEMATVNDEGMLELPSLARSRSGAAQGWPFVRETVHSYSGDRIASVISLTQAWERRHLLGLDY
jgi:hypothetical protein